MAREIEAAGTSLDPSRSATVAHRKRPYHQSDASSQSNEVYSVASEDTSTNDGFVQVVTKKAKQRMRRREGSSSSSTSMVFTPRGPPAHTVLFVPHTTPGNFNLLKGQATSAFPEGLVPGGIKDVRVNPNRNVIAIDVSEKSVLDRLTVINKLEDIVVRPCICQDTGISAGVIYNVTRPSVTPTCACS